MNGVVPIRYFAMNLGLPSFHQFCCCFKFIDMKNYRIVSFFLLLFFAMLAPACKTKSGCEANESLKPQMSKKGSFKKSKSTSGLFPKKMTKKMNK